MSNNSNRDNEKLQHPLADLDSNSPQSGSVLEISGSPEHLSSNQNDEAAPPESEYLSGLTLWINMVSLMLSIFLIAMDMVRVFFLSSFSNPFLQP